MKVTREIDLALRRALLASTEHLYDCKPIDPKKGAKK